MMTLLQNKSLYATPRLSLPAVERRGEKKSTNPLVRKKKTLDTNKNGPVAFIWSKV